MTISLNRVRGFDFHCHVDLHPDPAALVRRCETEGIVTIAVTTTPKAWPKNVEWAARCDYVLPAVGLHPELVGQRHTELPLLIQSIGDCALIGEVGLDGSMQHKASVARQREVFGRTLQAAQSLGGRVLLIHSRRAANEVIDMIAEHTTCDRALCILHWFTGSTSSARRAADLGCFFSVNGKMLESERGLALVRALPPDAILTETQPYCLTAFCDDSRRKRVFRFPRRLKDGFFQRHLSLPLVACRTLINRAYTMQIENTMVGKFTAARESEIGPKRHFAAPNNRVAIGVTTDIDRHRY